MTPSNMFISDLNPSPIFTTVSNFVVIYKIKLLKHKALAWSGYFFGMFRVITYEEYVAN